MNRPSRVAIQVQNCLATILREDVHEQELAAVTITRVWLSRDLKHARVYFLALGGGGDVEKLTVDLEAIQGRLRKRLSQRLQLRNTPKLRFYPDEDLEEAVRITNLLSGLDLTGGEE
jgi:ribosome-binding factor A